MASMAESTPAAEVVAERPGVEAAGGSRSLSAVRAIVERAPRNAGAISIVLGSLALTGWILGVDELKSIVPGTITMKANSAVAFILMGAAVWLADGASDGRARAASTVLALAAGLIAFVVGLQYVLDRDLGIDQLLFSEPAGAVGTVHPGRMSPQTALSFVLLALAIILAGRARASRPVLALTTIPLGLGALNLLDALFGAETPTLLGGFTQMALPTATAFVALSVGTTALLPGGGPLGGLAASGPGAILARRLLFAALVIPIVVGWLRLEGQRRGLYDTAYGVSITTGVMILLFLVAILLTARHLERAEEWRRAAEARTDEARLEAERARAEAEQARGQAEEASRAKSEFVSRMSHELRTPLNAVLGFSQLLAMDELEGRQREAVEQINKGGRHLLELINEVLDIASIEAGRLSLSIEPVDLETVVDEAVGLVRPLAGERGVKVETVRIQGTVLADRQRLKQILLNLLSNAVKYDRPGGSVRVDVIGSGQAYRIRVSDTGQGIDPAMLERLFTPFDRLGAEASGVEGTGVGLALSRRLAEAMGGTVGVESQPGRGSTFWVELEAAAESAAKPAPEDLGAGGADPLARGTVLYVEDNPANIRLVEHILERRPGVRLLTAVQGALGVEFARQFAPDLILLDLNLPDVSGSVVLERLQADPSTATIPVVVISADATPGQIQRLLAAGARDYLTKPIDVARLMELLESHLGPGREAAA
jgi:signal transduction histidine kinase/ActR/RegA family two-component response regulator